MQDISNLALLFVFASVLPYILELLGKLDTEYMMYMSLIW